MQTSRTDRTSLPRPFPRAALCQDEVQFSVVKHLKERGAQIDGRFDVDRPVQTRNVLQNLGKAALDKILGGAELDPAAQFGAGKILTGALVGFQNAAERAHASTGRPRLAPPRVDREQRAVGPRRKPCFRR
jgi:hypothetical protein